MRYLNFIHSSITLAVLYAVTVLLLYYFSLNTASNVLNFIGVAILAFTSYFILKSKGGWVFLLYAFGLTFALISCALIEANGSYLIESQLTAQLTGAAGRNLFLATYFILVTYFAHRVFLRIIPSHLPKIQHAETLSRKFLLIVAFASLFYMALVLIIYGSPILIGIDRFKYFTEIAPPGYKWIYGLTIILGLVVGLATYKGFIRYRTGFSWLVLTIIMAIFGGEKFSGIFLLLFWFFLPFLSNYTVKARQFVIGALIILVLTGIVLMNYTLISGSTEIFVSRLALQGQMNYALDQISSSPQPLSVITKHLLGFGASEQETGLYHLMYQVAPASKVDRYLEYNVTFTVPFPANFIYYFGPYLAPLFIIILAIAAGLASALLLKSLRASNFILSIVLAKLFDLTYLSITMGKVYLLFEVKTALYISLIALYFITLASQRNTTHINP